MAPPGRGCASSAAPHAGQSATRNAGIAAATGDYILPLDSDDLVAPTYVSRAAAALDADPELGIVYCRAQFVGDAAGEWGLPEFSMRSLLIGPLIFVTSLFRRADWEAVGGLDETLRFREDHDFWLEIVGLDRTALRLDDILFSYRIHGPSVNSTFTRDLLVDTRILRNNAALYARHVPELVEEWFSRADRLNDYGHRYRVPERLIAEHPRAYGVLRRLKRGTDSARSLAARAAAGVRRGPRG